MSRPQISAVIPTCNRAALVCRAVESALAQTCPPDEIIVIDDGSTDDTRQRLEAYGERVRYAWQANAGGGAARNRGVELARQPWVAFLDSDDVWLPEHLDGLARAVEATEGRAALYFRDMLMDPPDGPTLWQMSGLQIETPHELRSDASDWILRRHLPVMLQASLFSRASLQEHAFAPGLRRRHDTHLLLRLGLGSAVCAVKGCGARRTADDQSGRRLTQLHGRDGAIYWEATTWLYADVLRQLPEVTHAQRGELRYRLAVAHWRLARLAWQQGRRRKVPGHVLRSLRARPRALLEAGLHWLGRPVSQLSSWALGL